METTETLLLRKILLRGLGADDNGMPFLQYIANALCAPAAINGEYPRRTVIDAIEELTAAVRELNNTIQNK